MLLTKKFSTTKEFSTHHCLRMGAVRQLDCTTVRTTNGRVRKGELLSWLPFVLSIWDAEIGERVHVVCSSPIINKSVVLNDDVVVRLLSKAVSRILAELHVLSKGIIFEIILPFKSIGLRNFLWFHRPRKIF